MGKVKPPINPAKVFAKFREIFGVRTYAHVNKLAGFDSGQVSRMRSGKITITPSFFLALCIAKDISPVEMCERTGIPQDYFLPE